MVGAFSHIERQEMGLHADTLASWKSIGEDGTESLTLPEDWETALTGAYDADIAASGETASAKVAEMQIEIDRLSAELQTTKAMNYDLIVNGPVGGADTEADSDPENSPNNEDNAGDSATDDDGIDSLFAEDKDED